MTPEQIRKQIDSIDKKEERLYKRRQKIMSACNHNRVSSKRDSNTGNYDPSADSYWTDFQCLDCDKRWTVTR